MPLETGSKLGPYEVVALIGKGGMGEVYRAHDARLGRDVALKVSADHFSERFDREARAVAALNHANVCTLHDVGPNYLVMELLEGTPVKGPYPEEEALRIAHQITDALEAAHERNIAHRDLKPGNIMVRADGVVKVLDFGLAKVGGATTSGASELVTVTLGTTQAGSVLGTPAYMAPEQAKGRADIDKRVDIWAFGVVFYELLTGERLFSGNDVTEVLAAVVLKEPDLSAVPARYRRMLRKCLEKDPKKRLRDIGNVWELVENAVPPTTAANAVSKWAWLTAAAAVIVAGAALWAPWRTEPRRDIVRFPIVPHEGTTIGNIAVISPNGRKVAFFAQGPDNQQVIWVHSLDASDPRRLEDTQGAANGVFWSPDSRHIGFAIGGSVKRMDADGGPVQTLANLAVQFRGGAWNREGVIIVGSLRSGLFRMPESGGDLTPLTVLDNSRQEAWHGNPEFLPDGKHFLYWRSSAKTENSGIYIGSLDAAPEQQNSQRLLEARAGVKYAGGYLLFERERNLMAQPFDTSSLQLTGEAQVIAGNLNTAGPPAYSSSDNDILAFRTGRTGADVSSLLWFDRSGTKVGQVGPPAQYEGIQFTDGKRLLVQQTDAVGIGHSWTADLPRAIFSRLNPGDIADTSGAMAPDGRVAFSSPTSGFGDLHVRQANGLGQPGLLVKSPNLKHPNHWSPDGRYLIYDEHHPSQRQDLYVLPMDPALTERKPIPFLVTTADETFGQFSPDGKWVAYDSEESGRREVYVQGFAPDKSPAASVGKWTISSAGGSKPRWSRNGRELFYVARDGKMMAVPVKSTATTFEPGTPVALFQTSLTGFFPYDVAADGRFLINTVLAGETDEGLPITVILHWRELLKK